MSLDISKIKAVIFDYGNTLIEFGPDQVTRMNQDLFKLVNELFGPCDEKKFCEIRKQQIIAPYGTEDYIENDREGICRDLIHELYGIIPDDSQVKMMMNSKQETFVDAVTCPEFLKPVFDNLKSEYRLAFISNYPCTESITGSLKKLGLYDYFESVVISGSIGVVKPHPDIFRKSLTEIGLQPKDCVYVGDNWLADIQGAKRIGMQTIHTTQYVSYESFEPFEGDFPPDCVISHFKELSNILL